MKKLFALLLTLALVLSFGVTALAAVPPTMIHAPTTYGALTTPCLLSKSDAAADKRGVPQPCSYT